MREKSDVLPKKREKSDELQRIKITKTKSVLDSISNELKYQNTVFKITKSKIN